MFPFPPELYFRLQKQGALPPKVFRARGTDASVGVSTTLQLPIPAGYDLILDNIYVSAAATGGETVSSIGVGIYYDAKLLTLFGELPAAASAVLDRQFNGIYVLSGSVVYATFAFSAGVNAKSKVLNAFGILVPESGISDFIETI